jgi:hypothetical protein
MIWYQVFSVLSGPILLVGKIKHGMIEAGVQSLALGISEEHMIAASDKDGQFRQVFHIIFCLLGFSDKA